MLNEALLASEILATRSFGLEVVNMPWLNRLDTNWLENIIRNHIKIFVLEDHAPVGGLGDFLLHQMIKNSMLALKQFKIFSVEGFPACGTPSEALQYHGLNGESLAKSIKTIMYEKQSSIQ
jgi:transketolase